ncbi:MAG: hypothetical protein JW891_04460 [Candidatus Lokiarchaeota archaeon]|nr:hypothetical protein [Candidatus Lokiarchaeota archaeon]
MKKILIKSAFFTLMKKVKSISNAILLRINKNFRKKIIPFKNHQFFKDYSYAFIVESATEKCIKMTIYPQNTSNIIKLAIQIPDGEGNIVKEFPQILKDYGLLHASGLLKVGEIMVYECYLNVKYNSIEMETLKKILNGIANPSIIISFQKVKTI